MLESETATATTPPQRKSWSLGRIGLDVRGGATARRRGAALVVAVAVGLALSSLILLVAGVPLGDTARAFFLEPFTHAANIQSVLRQTAPLVMVGLSAAIGFRARFWNIGIEGQLICGAIAATMISVYHVGPEATRLPLMLVSGIIGGIAWAGITAALKLRFGVNEVISTLLLNYVAADLLYHLILGPWSDPADLYPRSPLYAASERLGVLAWGIRAELPLALICCALCWWLVERSRTGIYMRFVDANARMALVAGIPVAAVTALAAAFSGGLAGVAGFVVAGQEGRLTDSFFVGYGFSGILIAFLARNNPLAVVLVSFLVAVLYDAGRSLQVFDQIPYAIVLIVEAIIVMSVAASEFFLRHRVRWVR